MKTALLALATVSVMLMAVSCRQSKGDRSIEPAAESGSMKKIYLALIDYEVEHGQFPDSLSDLVDQGALTPEDLLFRRVDGSLDNPEYFPKAEGGTSALLAFEPDRNADRIIVNVDGSVRSESKTEQGGTGQPATRSQSKPEGSDKPQPEAEGRSR